MTVLPRATIVHRQELTDELWAPVGEKASFPQRLKKIENSLDVEKANLVFAHIVVPHRPFVFDENCKFDGGRQLEGGEGSQWGDFPPQER